MKDAFTFARENLERLTRPGGHIMFKVGDKVVTKNAKPGSDDFDHGVVIRTTHGGAVRVHWQIADDTYWESAEHLAPMGDECKRCGGPAGTEATGRVSFGVVGPFCSNACRDAFADNREGGRGDL
jgi:hypothetical protein